MNSKLSGYVISNMRQTKGQNMADPKRSPVTGFPAGL